RRWRSLWISSSEHRMHRQVFINPAVALGVGDRQSFREVVSEKWMAAFLEKLELETGQRSFTYCIAVTKLSGKNIHEKRELLENSEVIKNRFKKHGARIMIKILPLEEIIKSINDRMNQKQTPVLENTDIGRLLQLLHAAEINEI
ncbi:MAG: hypothetical protein AWU57_5693, partial [Marinobacter sp. T13-3]